MWLLVVDAVKPGALPLDPAPAESPFPCGGLVSDSAPGRGGTGINCRSAMRPPIVYTEKHYSLGSRNCPVSFRLFRS